MMNFVLNLGLRFVAALLPLTLVSTAAIAQTTSFSTIDTFDDPSSDAFAPSGSVVFDKAGNLFGITQYPSDYTGSTLFEATPTAIGKWTRKTLGIDTYGNFVGSPAIDASGNLYIAANSDSNNNVGAVFEISPSKDNKWTTTRLFQFSLAHRGGAYPVTGLILDKEGSLYGITGAGGAYGGYFDGGSVYKLSREKDGTWKETTLYSFKSAPYGSQSGGLTFDTAGNLYGTVMEDDFCAGAAFSLKRPQTKGVSWQFTTLHKFPGRDKNGNDPSGDAACTSALIFDAEGNLYGTSRLGGAYNSGTVFEIPAGGGEDGPDNILYSFYQGDFGGYHPLGGLTLDRSGNLYGTLSEGGHYPTAFEGVGGGKLFELMPEQTGAWSMRSLHDFGGRLSHSILGADGILPSGSLTIGPDGSFYGVTQAGGHYPGQSSAGGSGTVFKVTLR